MVMARRKGKEEVMAVTMAGKVVDPAAAEGMG